MSERTGLGLLETVTIKAIGELIASASAIVAGLFGDRNFLDVVTRSFVASTSVSAVALVSAILETIALCVLGGIAKDSAGLREIALVGTVAAFFLTSADTAVFVRQ